MRKVNKSPKIPYSALVREMEKLSQIRIQGLITTKKLISSFDCYAQYSTKFQ